jgi:hypothetical protein
LLSLLNQLLDYTNASSTSFQQCIEGIELKISETLQSLREKFLLKTVVFETNNTNTCLQVKTSWVLLWIDIASSILLWQKWIKKEKLMFWFISLILNDMILPCLLHLPKEEKDVELKEKVGSYFLIFYKKTIIYKFV